MQIRRASSGLSVVLALLMASPISSPAQEPEIPPPGKLGIVIVEGDGAVNNIRQRVAREPIVQVEDENHKPVAGAVVTFLLPNQGAGASFANGAKSLTVVTDSKGQAVARGLRPNNVNGQYQVRVNASFRGQNASTTINQSNAITATTAGAGISAKLITILAIAGGAAIAGGVYAATRGGGNTPGAIGPTATTITPGQPSIGAPR